jgi:predicted amidohydrolase
LEENPLLRKFAALSAELNVVLPVSFFERANKAHYNSIVIIDAGKIVGLYRKAHIPDGPGMLSLIPCSSFAFPTRGLCRILLITCWIMCIHINRLY